MKSKILVHGKSQSRTVLGIVNAYLKLHPDSTLADLQQLFVKSLRHHSNPSSIIVPEKETQGREKQYFEREDELIVLKNGQRYALYEPWVKEDYEAVCEHAKQYGIAVAKVGAKPFEKGSYHLEYLNRKFSWWWVILLLLLVLLLIALLLWGKGCSCSRNEKSVSPTVTAVEDVITEEISTENIVIEDKLISDEGNELSFTLPDGTAWKIGKNSAEYKLFTFLNSDEAVDESAKGWITLDKNHFGVGKATLDTESEVQLKNVAMILKFFPNSSIKIGGYTDNSGTSKTNEKLSVDRAKATADKLIAFGIDANRIAYKGYGALHPVCPANDTDECKAANRRVDIRVTKK